MDTHTHLLGRNLSALEDSEDVLTRSLPLPQEFPGDLAQELRGFGGCKWSPMRCETQRATPRAWILFQAGLYAEGEWQSSGLRHQVPADR